MRDLDGARGLRMALRVIARLRVGSIAARISRLAIPLVGTSAASAPSATAAMAAVRRAGRVTGVRAALRLRRGLGKRLTFLDQACACFAYLVFVR